MNARTICRNPWIAPLVGLMYMAAGCAHVDRYPSDTGLLNGFDAKEARLMLDERVSEIVNAANEMHERDETILRTTEPYHYRVSEYYPQGPDPDKF